MNKSQLVEALAARFGGNKAEATRALNAVADTIMEQVGSGQKVSISGFGSFERMHRDARVVRNPRTGERKPVEETWVARFRPGTEFKAWAAGERGTVPARPARQSNGRRTARRTSS